MIWLMFAALLLVGLSVLFLGRTKSGDGAVDPVAHYQAQLDEIDTDEARQMIDADSAKTARIELQRRLLRAGQVKRGRFAIEAGAFARSTLVVGVVSIILVAAVFYAWMGSPSVPAANPSPRLQAANQLVEEGGPTLGEALAQVREHLQTNPRDMEGWQVLARTAQSIGDYETAASAFGELARMNPDEPNWRVSELEAFMGHAGGQITPAGRLVLAALIDMAPNHPAGQFYLGLVQLQSGNEDGARAVWTALADRSSENAPWMPVVRRQLAAIGGSGPPQLTEEDVAVVDAMDDEEREAFLASMLSRLEDRLESDPADVAGWLMLARSKLALDDREGAIAALESGIAANPGEKSADLQAFLDNLPSSPDL